MEKLSVFLRKTLSFLGETKPFSFIARRVCVTQDLFEETIQYLHIALRKQFPELLRDERLWREKWNVSHDLGIVAI